MPKPIGYFACAPSGTSGATCLFQIEQQFGSYLEHLTPAQVAAWVVTLVSEAVEPQGIEVEIALDNCNLEPLISLSNGIKLVLAAAALSYLQKRTSTRPNGGRK